MQIFDLHQLLVWQKIKQRQAMGIPRIARPKLKPRSARDLRSRHLHRQVRSESNLGISRHSSIRRHIASGETAHHPASAVSVPKPATYLVMLIVLVASGKCFALKRGSIPELKNGMLNVGNRQR